MPYTAEISRTNPTCFLFLIDQSESMADPQGGNDEGKKKAEVVSDAVNRLLQNLVLRCSKGESVRDYFRIGVIAYGSNVGPALGGTLAGRYLVPISELEKTPIVEDRVQDFPDGAGGLVPKPIKFCVWLEPVADGATPMCEALELARQIVAEFINDAPRCFPPIVLNITDGESTDGDPEAAAAAIRDLETEDGNVLLFNLHLSSSHEKQLRYPSSESVVSDEYGKLLFRMSSVLPPNARAEAAKKFKGVTETSRGFIFNADIVSVVQFLELGTKVDQNLR